MNVVFRDVWHYFNSRATNDHSHVVYWSILLEDAKYPWGFSVEFPLEPHTSAKCNTKRTSSFKWHSGLRAHSQSRKVTCSYFRKYTAQNLNCRSGFIELISFKEIRYFMPLKHAYYGYLVQRSLVFLRLLFLSDYLFFISLTTSQQFASWKVFFALPCVLVSYLRQNKSTTIPNK